MRVPLVAGNWKMNLNREQSIGLAREITGISEMECEVAVCPPFVYLDAVREIVRGTSVGLGAQNVHWEKNGAFTGEISLSMLENLGVTHVILGHSERRQFFGETDETVNRRLQGVLKNSKIVPIVCVGESLAQRESGETQKVIERQFAGAFAGIDREWVERVVIAYEPVWAIGTGKTASPEQAQAVHGDLRKLIENRYNADLSGAIRILYGGSVKADNAQQLMAQPDIDGALVGGASLQFEPFAQIVNAASKLQTN